MTPVCWAKPPFGWHKLNTDGASLGNPGKAGGGGLIQDHQGKWIKGFMRRIGLVTSITAELWALRDGLMLAKQIGITHLVVEMDNKVIVDLVQSNKATNNSYSSLLNDCRFLLRQLHRFKINHAFRKANRSVDYLAKGGCSLLRNFVVLDCPPTDELCHILDSDASGLYSLRLVATTSPFMAS